MMLSELRVSVGRCPPVLVLLPLLFFLTHCQKKDESPPPPKAAQAHPSSNCCRLTATTGLKEGVGRFVVAFPNGAEPKDTRVDVLTDGKVVHSGYGNQSRELPPGTYDVTISTKPLSGVIVQAGYETQVKVGVLHINATQDTRVDLLDGTSGKVLTGGYGEKSYGLPIGAVTVQVAGQSETVTIEDGTVTE
ncbi:MAG: hypothetical protein HP498_00395, partial [Nitrospira sp.]|nr:hypothetical protein [Nitrospira sp.]